MSVDNRSLRISMIDDHAVIHDGIATWCAQADPPIGISGAFASVDEFESVTPDSDVVIFDLQLDSGAPELGALRRLCDRGLRVIVFSQHTASGIVMECLDLGAVTYLSKGEGREHLIAAIRAAGTDQPYLGPTMAKAMTDDTRSLRPRLSDREREVLISWFQADSQELVGKRLFITAGTVKTHLGRIRTKYASVGRPAATKAALVARALQDGLITVDEL